MIVVRVAAVSVVLAVGVLAGARPVAAHEGEDEGPAGDLVRQAIALIVNTPDDLDMIGDKIADAPEAEDTSGVELDLVEQAGEAIESGDLHEARTLLERSIGAQPHLSGAEPAPIGKTTGELARGDEPGAEFIADPLEMPGRLDGGDRVLLVASIAVGMAGVWLGLRWRPVRRRPA